MWILIITTIIGGILIFVFGDCEKISKQNQAALSYAVWVVTTLVFTIVLLNHSNCITKTIKAYQEGRIVKQETITIENGDTIKVVKYKYK